MRPAGDVPQLLQEPRVTQGEFAEGHLAKQQQLRGDKHNRAMHNVAGAM
jgi:hypothetical protein